MFFYLKFYLIYYNQDKLFSYNSYLNQKETKLMIKNVNKFLSNMVKFELNLLLPYNYSKLLKLFLYSCCLLNNKHKSA